MVKKVMIGVALMLLGVAVRAIAFDSATLA
jgi:hypothetical protein